MIKISDSVALCFLASAIQETAAHPVHLLPVAVVIVVTVAVARPVDFLWTVTMCLAAGYLDPKVFPHRKYVRARLEPAGLGRDEYARAR